VKEEKIIIFFFIKKFKQMCNPENEHFL